MKPFTIIRSGRRSDHESEYTSITEAVKAYSYTLECGASWSHEPGNQKINCSPKTAKSLVSNLNKAVDNSAANGYSSTRYRLK